MRVGRRPEQARRPRERIPGRGLIAASVITTAVIQPLVDLTGSHAFNEDWPPHAHFHDLAAIGPALPRVGRFTIYPNATVAALQLGLLAAGWWRYRTADAAA